MADPIDDYMAEVGHEAATAAELGRLMRLTPRELQVLEARALTESNVAAGERLGITRSTINNHLGRIYLKVNEVELISVYRRLGWLRVPGSSAPQAIPTESALHTVSAGRGGRNVSPSSSGTPAGRTTRGPGVDTGTGEP